DAQGSEHRELMGEPPIKVSMMRVRRREKTSVTLGAEELKRRQAETVNQAPSTGGNSVN
ncbi:hypothetical protein HAX54_001279, partial [Datura stramonium]|nr:hypothetical protein [Datura stramonium]